MIYYDDFQLVNFIFSQKKSFHYFEDLFNDETDLRVRYVPIWFSIPSSSFSHS